MHSRRLHKWLNRTEAEPSSHLTWFWRAILLAQTGGMEQYRSHCRDMLKRFEGTTDRPTADRIARACLFVANSGVDIAIPAQLADRAVSGGEHRWMVHFQITKGLAEYRSGRYEGALGWLRRSADATRGTPLGHAFVEAALGMGMAQCRLGQLEEARRYLAEAETVLDRLPRPGEKGFDAEFADWIICQTLRREAEALIRPGPTTRPAP